MIGRGLGRYRGRLLESSRFKVVRSNFVLRIRESSVGCRNFRLRIREWRVGCRNFCLRIREWRVGSRNFRLRLVERRCGSTIFRSRLVEQTVHSHKVSSVTGELSTKSSFLTIF